MSFSARPSTSCRWAAWPSPSACHRRRGGGRGEHPPPFRTRARRTTRWSARRRSWWRRSSGSTLTTVVVFAPLGLLSGVVGQFFRALSITLGVSVLLSLGLALTLIPLLAPWAYAGAHAPRRPLAGLDERYAQPLVAGAAPAPAPCWSVRRRSWPLLACWPTRGGHRIPPQDGRRRVRDRLPEPSGQRARGDGPAGAARRGAAVGDARGRVLLPPHRRRSSACSRPQPNKGDVLVRLKPRSASARARPSA